jgi:thiamine kinase-like enzyme
VWTSEWPSQWIALPMVERWVRAELGADDVGFAELLGRKWYPADGGRRWWNLTARFRANDLNVVFKATAQGLFPQSVPVQEIVARAFPDRAPAVLAHRERDDQIWFLHEWVEGRTLRQQATVDGLASVARALAEVQVAAASLDLSGLPRIRPSEVPALLLEDGLRDQPPRLVRWLERAQPWLQARAGELEAFPLSLDHPDVNAWNALIRPDGQVVFVDWEETIVSSPFFSVERLLGQVGDDAVGELAAAYVEGLPWETERTRWSALQAALCLTPLKAAYEARVFARRLGWDDPHTEWTTLLIADASERSRRSRGSRWFGAKGSPLAGSLERVLLERLGRPS